MFDGSLIHGSQMAVFVSINGRRAREPTAIGIKTLIPRAHLKISDRFQHINWTRGRTNIQSIANG